MTPDTLSQRLSTIPYVKTLGVTPITLGAELTMLLPYKDSNIGNPFIPALHGGVIGGFMEVSAIAEIIFFTDLKTLPKPIGINVDYLRSGKAIDCYARAYIARLGSRVVNVRVSCWQESFDKPIAQLHGHYLISSNPDA